MSNKDLLNLSIYLNKSVDGVYFPLTGNGSNLIVNPLTHPVDSYKPKLLSNISWWWLFVGIKCNVVFSFDGNVMPIFPPNVNVSVKTGIRHQTLLWRMV
ncbi:MAG: hypothetical protein ACTS4X_00795 [Candidatus Hodgkinia cicadicola]